MDKKFAAYVSSTLFILGWWLAAFFPHQSTSQHIIISSQELPFPSPLPYLSSMKRESIQQALAGDVSLIGKLMTEWDLDAEILQSHGYSGIKNLPRESYIRAQTLGRFLKNQGEENITRIGGYIPQTYIAATYLLALTPPDRIICLPVGFRSQTDVFPISLTQKIPLDLDRYKSETLFLKQPTLAFVSHFSHPAMLQTLHNQGIKLYSLDCPTHLEEIPDNIQKMGQVTDCSLKAELLNTFLAAAFIAIENRVQATSNLESTKVMLLNYYSQFSVPTEKTLTVQLLKRLGVIHYHAEEEALYTRPIGKEEILKWNPDVLLISTPHRMEFKNCPELAALPKVSLLDDTVQQSPTQFIVLAYYDIAKALLTP